jgi:hypothetical protein
LVAEVCKGEIGAVFCNEASRLARNGREWHHLIDLCGMVGAVVVDFDGVYDLNLVNDRLLLGLKGTMSEFPISTCSKPFSWSLTSWSSWEVFARHCSVSASVIFLSPCCLGIRANLRSIGNCPSIARSELEARWNGALQKKQELENRLADFDRGINQASVPSKDLLLSLVQDLPAIWNLPSTDMRLKQRIVRILIEEVVADVDESSREIQPAGGCRR